MSVLAARIESVLAEIGAAVVACSGGIDSTLLAFVAHRRAPGQVIVAHAVSPAVPAEGTGRVRALAEVEGWNLRIVRSGEFADESYLANPVNRCYFCKSNLYASLDAVSGELDGEGTILSGANVDDLGEYRPGLIAAGEKGVRHPWVEAGFGKAEIRALARELGLPFAELPASPCLASRLYTGTRVTAERLRAVHECEALVKARTGLEVVRCRVREDAMLLEVPDTGRERIGHALLAELAALARAIEPGIRTVALDAGAYRPGRAFVGAK
ncbi:MAG: ATP-dependent sacrificial sulfur transferase LarE [Novosphingobium sp.]|nr:ATP-dependent sacrificial sulfur transferase LarE [Novosphingobium sp.]